MPSPAGQLHDAQPVALRVEAHGLRIDRHAVRKAEARGQIVLVQLDDGAHGIHPAISIASKVSASNSTKRLSKGGKPPPSPEIVRLSTFAQHLALELARADTSSTACQDPLASPQERRNEDYRLPRARRCRLTTRRPPPPEAGGRSLCPQASRRAIHAIGFSAPHAARSAHPSSLRDDWKRGLKMRSEELQKSDAVAPYSATVVVTGYNQEAFIREAIMGALAQDQDRLEIILSDDGSSDRTYAIMQTEANSYRGSHTVILNRNPHNLGIVHHVNRLFELASSEFIIFCHGDDISLPASCLKYVAGLYRKKPLLVLSFER